MKKLKGYAVQWTADGDWLATTRAEQSTATRSGWWTKVEAERRVFSEEVQAHNWLRDMDSGYFKNCAMLGQVRFVQVFEEVADPEPVGPVVVKWATSYGGQYVKNAGPDIRGGWHHSHVKTAEEATVFPSAAEAWRALEMAGMWPNNARMLFVLLAAPAEPAVARVSKVAAEEKKAGPGKIIKVALPALPPKSKAEVVPPDALVAVDRQDMTAKVLPIGRHTVQVISRHTDLNAVLSPGVRYFLPDLNPDELVGLYGTAHGGRMLELIEKGRKLPGGEIRGSVPGTGVEIPTSRITAPPRYALPEQRTIPSWTDFASGPPNPTQCQCVNCKEARRWDSAAELEKVRKAEEAKRCDALKEPPHGFAVVMCRPDGSVFGVPGRDAVFMRPDMTWTESATVFGSKEEAQRAVQAPARAGHQESPAWQRGRYGRRLAYLTRGVPAFHWNEFLIRKRHVIRYPSQATADRARLRMRDSHEFQVVPEGGEFTVRSRHPETFQTFAAALDRVKKLSGGADVWEIQTRSVER